MMTDLEKLLAEATPGPWTAREIKGHTFSQVSGEIPICDVEGLRLAEVGGYGHDAKTRMVRLGEESANARLIALAPQLASALIEARETLSDVISACDNARMIPKPGHGVGGMTIEANIRGSVYNGVDAWPVEEARAALARIDAIMGERDD